MGGGNKASTWADVEGKPDQVFIKARRRQIKHDAGVARQLRENGTDARLRQLHAGINAAFEKLHVKRVAGMVVEVKMSAARRQATIASARAGLEAVYLHEHMDTGGGCFDCVAQSCRNTGRTSQCTTPLLHSSLVQDAMDECDCTTSRSTAHVTHTRLGCMHRGKAAQAPEPALEAAVNAVYAEARAIAPAVKRELVAHGDREAERAATGNVDAAVATSSGVVSKVPKAMAPRRQSILEFGFAKPAASTPHRNIEAAVQSRLNEMKFALAVPFGNSQSVFGAKNIGSHESVWFREMLSNHLREHINGTAEATRPVPGRMASSSGRGMTSLPDCPDLASYYSAGASTHIVDFGHPSFRACLNASGMKCVPCGHPDCADAPKGLYNTSPKTRASGCKTENWSSFRGQPISIIGPGGLSSPMISAVSMCNTCAKPHRHCSRHCVMRMPHEAQARVPFEGLWGQRGGERWILSKELTATLGYDLTTNQGFASIASRLLEAGKLTETRQHRAYNSAVLSYHDALEAAVGDVAWSHTSDTVRVELMERRAEWLHMQWLMREGGGLPQCVTGSSGSTVYVPGASGPSSIEEAFLATAESLRRFRLRCQNELGAECWVSIDLTKRSGKKFGNKDYWLATMCNEDGILIATTVVDGTGIEKIEPWFRAVAARDSWRRKGLPLGVVIDNVPPGTTNEADPANRQPFVRRHLEALEADFIIQDKHHTRQAASKHFNNTHPDFWGDVIQGLRHATSELHQTLESDLDDRLQKGLVVFKKARTFRGTKYSLPRKRVLPVSDLTAALKKNPRARDVCMTEAQAMDPNHPHGIPTSDHEIAAMKESGAHQEFFSRESTVVPQVSVSKSTMERRMSELTARIEAKHFRDGVPLQCKLTKKVLISSIDVLRTVMSNCLARAVLTTLPPTVNAKGFTALTRVDPKTKAMTPKLCTQTGMVQHRMDYHSGCNESFHSRIIDIISSDTGGPELGTALFYEGVPRLNRGVDEARGRSSVGHDQPWICHETIDMERRIPGLFQERASPAHRGLPPKPGPRRQTRAPAPAVRALGTLASAANPPAAAPEMPVPGMPMPGAPAAGTIAEPMITEDQKGEAIEAALAVGAAPTAAHWIDPAGEMGMVAEAALALGAAPTAAHWTDPAGEMGRQMSNMHSESTVTPDALSGHGMPVGPFDKASKRRRGEAPVHAEPPRLKAVRRVFGSGNLHASGDPGTTKLHAISANFLRSIESVTASARGKVHEPNFTEAARQHRLHFEQIMLQAQNGMSALAEATSDQRRQPSGAEVAAGASPRPDDVEAKGTPEPELEPNEPELEPNEPPGLFRKAASLLGWMTSRPCNAEATTATASSHAASAPPPPPPGPNPDPPATASSSAVPALPTLASTACSPAAAPGTPGVQPAVASATNSRKRKAKQQTLWPCTCMDDGMPLYPVMLDSGKLYQYSVSAGRKAHRSSCAKVAKEQEGVLPRVGDVVTVAEGSGVRSGQSLEFIGGQGKGRWKGWGFVDGSSAYINDATPPPNLKFDWRQKRIAKNARL